MDVLKKIPVREQDPKEGATNFKKVCLGYSQGEAQEEALCCINCKNTKCIQGCPVAINIPKFTAEIEEGEFEDAASTIAEPNALPAMCGHVRPQESQCKGKCVHGIEGEPISIGELERFVTDWSRENGFAPAKPEKTNGIKVAVIGSGPAEPTCAGDLTKMEHKITTFEALHEPGGVPTYGIPEFRLPKSGIVRPEIGNVKKLGVKAETNVIIGESVTIDELIDEEGYKAVFIGSGAEFPKFMGIPGKNVNSVFSVDEYLTRSNLMKALRDDYDTSIYLDKEVAVVGSRNAAMDAVRTALRLGAGMHIVYRRNEVELSTRVGEVYHAKEEGIIFNLLTNPVEILTGDNGRAKRMVMRKMELDEPDTSGHRRPVKVAGFDYIIDADAVIMFLGTSPNPLMSSITGDPETDGWKRIIADESSGKTTKGGVYTGGDVVTGAVIVTFAMEVGRAGARGTGEYLNGNK